MAASKADERFGKFLASLGVGLFVAGIAVFGYQVLFWLRYGDWTYIDVGSAWRWIGLQTPPVRAVGLERVFSWIFAAPFAGASAIVGGVLIWLGLAVVER